MVEERLRIMAETEKVRLEKVLQDTEHNESIALLEKQAEVDRLTVAYEEELAEDE